MGVYALRSELIAIRKSMKENLSGLGGDNPQTKEERIKMEAHLDIVDAVIKYINGNKVNLMLFKL